MAYRKLRPVGDDGHDPWLGVDGGYDPQKFYVESCDRAGKASTHKELRIPEHLATEIARLIASGKLGGTPIQHFNDAARDALVHWMHKMTQMFELGLFERAAERARIAGQMDVLESTYAGYRERVDQVRHGVSQAIADESVQFADDLLRVTEPIVEFYPKPYCTQIEDSLKELRQWVSRRRPQLVE